ncbi:MAG: hypothetical protein NVS2B14_12380 [Chamaesiphon sp.]
MDTSERIHPQAGGHIPFIPETSLIGLNILVVDDEPDARMLLTTLLEQCGAMVQSAASVSEALLAIAQQRPDILISDVGMPDEDGYAHQ